MARGHAAAAMAALALCACGDKDGATIDGPPGVIDAGVDGELPPPPPPPADAPPGTPDGQGTPDAPPGVPDAFIPPDAGPPPSVDDQLCDAINGRRADAGLAAVPQSSSVMLVARLHVEDLTANG